MARLIDADAFHEELKEMYDGLNLIYDGLLYGEERNICKGQIGILMECALRLKEQPTIDTVKKGKWIEKRGHRSFISGGDIEDYTYYICSECAREEITKEPYCHCGARMDGDSE